MTERSGMTPQALREVATNRSAWLSWPEVQKICGELATMKDGMEAISAKLTYVRCEMDRMADPARYGAESYIHALEFALGALKGDLS